MQHIGRKQHQSCKMGEPIKLPFGIVNEVCSRNVRCMSRFVTGKGSFFLGGGLGESWYPLVSI